MSFLNTVLRFTQNLDYKTANAIHADRPSVYSTDKISKLCTINKIHLKCGCINGSIINGIQQSNLCTFILNEPPDFKVFSEPEKFIPKKLTILLWIL